MVTVKLHCLLKSKFPIRRQRGAAALTLSPGLDEYLGIQLLSSQESKAPFSFSRKRHILLVPAAAAAGACEEGGAGMTRCFWPQFSAKQLRSHRVPTAGARGLQHIDSFCLSPSIPNQTSSNKRKLTCVVLVPHDQTAQDPVTIPWESRSFST